MSGAQHRTADWHREQAAAALAATDRYVRQAMSSLDLSPDVAVRHLRAVISLASTAADHATELEASAPTAVRAG